MFLPFVYIFALLLEWCAAQYTTVSGGSNLGSTTSSGSTATSSSSSGSTTTAGSGSGLCTGNCSEANTGAIVLDYAHAANQVTILAVAPPTSNDSTTLDYWNKANLINNNHDRLNGYLMGRPLAMGATCLGDLINTSIAIGNTLTIAKQPLACPIPAWGQYQYALGHLGNGVTAFINTYNQCANCSNPGRYLNVIISAQLATDLTLQLVATNDTSSNCSNADFQASQGWNQIMASAGGFAGNGTSAATQAVIASTPTTVYPCPQPGQQSTITSSGQPTAASNGQGSYYGKKK